MVGNCATDKRGERKTWRDEKARSRPRRERNGGRERHSFSDTGGDKHGEKEKKSK